MERHLAFGLIVQCGFGKEQLDYASQALHRHLIILYVLAELDDLKGTMIILL